jgi:1-deoxy-D-xylulose-5-phosphate reductoisomerase
LNDKTKNLVILGSTGSIGKQALEIVAQHQDKFKVIGLAALDEVDELSRQVDKFKPQMIALGDANKYGQARKALAGKTAISVGVEGMCELAGLEAADIVLVAVSGAVGILPTLEAVKNGKRVALANKETLVAAGEIVMQEVVARHIELIPGIANIPPYSSVCRATGNICGISGLPLRAVHSESFPWPSWKRLRWRWPCGIPIGKWDLK